MGIAIVKITKHLHEFRTRKTLSNHLRSGHTTAPCPTRESAECRCGLGSVTGSISITNVARQNLNLLIGDGADHDGLVSVRSCVDLHVKNYTAILSPYDGQHATGSRVGPGENMCVPAFRQLHKGTPGHPGRRTPAMGERPLDHRLYLQCYPVAYFHLII
ncbi:hypothetical protein J6590_057585 [Homalodisca vitripennis]|nr:hypothetical protein J6590_057585 [Homalodisca vitripennis]